MGVNLEEWEMVCDKCKGGGSFPKKFSKLEDPYYSTCSKCQGKGKVDWIENIVGRKPEFIGNDNVFIGYQAGLSRSTGADNVIIRKELFE